MDAIKALQSIKSSNVAKIASEDKNIQKTDFKDFLISSLEKVNADQNYANEMDEALAVGAVDNLHDVMIASQKAEITLSLAVEVRNKVIEAYKEIMRIQM